MTGGSLNMPVAEPTIFEITACNRREGEAGVEMARLLAIVRLAAVCEVLSLDRETIERILQNDPSVCGASNPSAFARLRGMLQRHHEVRKHTVAHDKEAATSLIAEAIVECLRIQTSASRPVENAKQSFIA